jgi:hypothetical protein
MLLMCFGFLKFVSIYWWRGNFKKKCKSFFHQPNPTLSKDKSQFSLVLFGEKHIALM